MFLVGFHYRGNPPGKVIPPPAPPAPPGRGVRPPGAGRAAPPKVTAPPAVPAPPRPVNPAAVPLGPWVPKAPPRVTAACPPPPSPGATIVVPPSRRPARRGVRVFDFLVFLAIISASHAYEPVYSWKANGRSGLPEDCLPAIYGCRRRRKVTHSEAQRQPTPRRLPQ